MYLDDLQTAEQDPFDPTGMQVISFVSIIYCD